MLRPEQQELLTRIGPGTRMGALLRRSWHPIAASVEPAPGKTLPVRLLGEDLVLFRRSSGQAGLFEAACPPSRRVPGARPGGERHTDLPMRCPLHWSRLETSPGPA